MAFENKLHFLRYQGKTQLNNTYVLYILFLHVIKFFVEIKIKSDSQIEEEELS